MYKENISICSTTDLSIETFLQAEAIEHIDTNVVLPPLEDLLPDDAPKEYLKPYDQTSQEKEGNWVSIQRKWKMPPLLTEEWVECLSQKHPKHNQMEQEVVLDEAHGLNP